MLEKRKKEYQVRQWIEGEKECLLERAYRAEDPFVGAFYAQCAESTAADGHEVFLETPLAFNYFREKLDILDEEGIRRFFRLAAIHHTIRIVRRRRKELEWETMAGALADIYLLDEREKALAALLYQCALCYQSGFHELFHKTTARYLFGDRVLHGFSFAFIGNFWYNSYSSFMGSFSGYVPFHIRMKQAL
ncbi:MAG: hypothetical protein Q4C06_02690 [Bacillota bacterium]|nr:hypothetical protein [Bacillota bacterium]